MLYYKDYDYSYLSKWAYRKVWERNHNSFAGETKGRYLINAPYSFDIETSYIPIADRCIMYIWQFGINGTVVYGRTWDEFRDFLKRFSKALHLCDRCYALVYIHNAGYEFEYLYSQIKITNIFARSTHSPIYFDAPEYSIEFRDSYILSGLKLEKTAENLTKHQINKLDGKKFDYKKIRHSGTPLTDYELQYCEYDALILNYFIEEEMEYCGDISKVPLTRTGYARRRFRSALRSDKTFWANWHRRLMACYPSPDEFCLLNKCFMGGYVHGNCQYIGYAVEDVTSIDFSSSYPCQMVRHKYPLSKWHKVNTEIISIEHFEKQMCGRACIVDITFRNVKSKTQHHITSKNKCKNISEDAIFDNGRLVSASMIHTYMTDVDYKIFKKFYSFDKIYVTEMYTNSYEYLPTPFIKELLNLYGIKTELKDVDGKEEEYQRGKGDLNAGYGMLCQNPISPEILFEEGEWKETKEADINIEEALLENKNSKGYFMPYAVGVWVTAWARYELLSTVYEIDKNNRIGDVIYNDTDSIKLVNYEEHKPIIEEYNKKCIEDIDKALKYHDIDVEKSRPKTIKGKTKQLGVFEIDAEYPLFKTLGCKRYCYLDKNNEFHYKASGISPADDGEPRKYMLLQSKIKNCHIFDIFDFGLEIPAENSGNLTHYCFNDKMRINITDYLNDTEFCEISSCCVLKPQPYHMKSNTAFLAFLAGEQLNRVGSTSTPKRGGKHPKLKIGFYD